MPKHEQWIALLFWKCLFFFCKREERLVDGFAAADRAFARFREPLTFVKDKPALRALGGLYNEMPFAPMERGADMRQVLIDVLLGDADPAGEFMGREGPLLQFDKQLVADGIMRHRRRTQA